MPVIGECKRVNDGVVVNNHHHYCRDWNEYNKSWEPIFDGAGAKNAGYKFYRQDAVQHIGIK